LKYSSYHGKIIPVSILKGKFTIMSKNEEYSILHEAYKHYRKTGDNHFIVLPKNPDYLLTALNSIPNMLERGFITNVSDNLLNDSSISLVPLEDMSFDITFNGITFIESRFRKEF